MAEPHVHTERSRIRHALAHLIPRRCVAPPTAEAPRDELRTCPVCHQPSVCPIAWRAHGEARWWILLRCGNCQCWREVIVANEQAAAFECDVARDIAAIARDLVYLERERMRADVNTFTIALAHDLIDPADFAR